MQPDQPLTDTLNGTDRFLFEERAKRLTVSIAFTVLYFIDSVEQITWSSSDVTNIFCRIGRLSHPFIRIELPASRTPFKRSIEKVKCFRNESPVETE